MKIRRTRIEYWITKDTNTHSEYIILNSEFVNPCIIIYSNKSTYQMHQSINQSKTLQPPRSNGKPEAATAVNKLLMMGMRMPETC